MKTWLAGVWLLGLVGACGSQSESIGPGAGSGSVGASTGGATASAAASSGMQTAAGAGGFGGASGGQRGMPEAGQPNAAGMSSQGGSAGEPYTGGSGFYRMERLNRGLVAVKVPAGVYVGWRLLGFEYESAVQFELARDGATIATVTGATNYLDPDGQGDSTYTIRPASGAVSESAKVWPEQYLRVPLELPEAGTTPSSCTNSNAAYQYTANDASPGDLDGDGQYELVLKWDPTNSKDNSQDGCTGNVYLEGYALSGARLWRIDLGPNIRAGAHYTQFVVQDFDGDGRAEIAVKTAPGTRDGSGHYLSLGPAAGDDDTAQYRNARGRVLSGPEYLTVFDGASGAELATVDFDQARGSVGEWGDDYGNRVDRFLATAAYLDDTGLASFVMARGYYTRATLSAWSYRDRKLSRIWKFDSEQTPKDASGHPYTSQGSHSMTVANVDGDLGQELMYGAAAIDHDGNGLCSTGFGHGDAEHVGDLVPSRPGLEFFMCHEDGKHPAYHLRDAKTCEILQQGPVNGADTGRCVAGDVDAVNPGAELWSSSTPELYSATSNASLGKKPGSTNFLVYWDADETRELEDQNHIDKYLAGKTERLLTADGVDSNNGTKATPTLTADLFGDWREEIVWRESDSRALRIYTTVDVTERRIYTLMHDPQYRMQVSAEQTAYNQPPHPGFHIGFGMLAPPVPNIRVK